MLYTGTVYFVQLQCILYTIHYTVFAVYELYQHCILYTQCVYSVHSAYGPLKYTHNVYTIYIFATFIVYGTAPPKYTHSEYKLCVFCAQCVLHPKVYSQ